MTCRSPQNETLNQRYALKARLFLASPESVGFAKPFTGGTPEALAALQRNLMAEFPALVIAGAVSPPFRPLTEAEDEALVVQINASGARTVWVGLKLPGPEKNGC